MTAMPLEAPWEGRARVPVARARHDPDPAQVSVNYPTDQTGKDFRIFTRFGSPSEDTTSHGTTPGLTAGSGPDPFNCLFQLPFFRTVRHHRQHLLTTVQQNITGKVDTDARYTKRHSAIKFAQQGLGTCAHHTSRRTLRTAANDSLQ